MKSRKRAALAAIATAAALIVISPSAHSESPGFAAGTVGVTGLSPGAGVTVDAWPSTTAGATLADDAEVDAVTLGTATADSSGTAAVDTSEAARALPASYVEPDGSTMYQIDVDNGTGLQSWSGDSDQIPDAGLTMADFSSMTPPDGQAQKSCDLAGVWSAYGWSFNHPQHYMIAYPRPDAREYVHIWDGSSHSIQIGFDGGYGVWTGTAMASMESHQNAGASESWVNPKNVYNKVDFHLYHRPCWQDPVCLKCGGLGKPDFWQHEGRAEVFADFYSIITPAPGPPNSIQWCYPHGAGYHLWKTQGSNQTFDLGTELFGAGLKVHAEYSHETTATWNLTAKVNMCGTWEGGIIKSALVAARKWGSRDCYPPPGPCVLPDGETN